MNETKETPAIATEQPAPVPASPEPAQAPAFPRTVSTHPQGVEVRRLELVEIGRRTRPWTILVNRRSDRQAHMGESLVRGSPEATRQEIKRLQELEKAQERQAREQEAEAKRFADLVRAEEERAQTSLLTEIKAMVKRCPGTITATPCPACATGPDFIKRVILSRPGTLDYPVEVMVKAPIFFMRQQKSGALTCPRCGHSVLAF